MNRYMFVFIFVVSAIALLCLTAILYVPHDQRWLLSTLITYGFPAWGISLIGFAIVCERFRLDRSLAGLAAAAVLVFISAALTGPHLPPIGIAANGALLFTLFAIPLANILNLMQFRVWPSAPAAA